TALTGGQVALALGGGLTVSATGITGAFLVTSAGVAGRLNVANISVNGVPGLASGSVTNATLELNNTNAAAAATIGGLSFSFSTAEKFNFISVNGQLELTVTVGPVSTVISGAFSFERTTTTVSEVPNTQIIRAAVQNATTSLTIGTAPGGVQVAFKQMNGALLLKTGGSAGKLTVGRITVTKADGVTPLPGLEFSATDLAV